jgi:uncharacterized membrane-anchored protein YhcB (DUF1043 family)
MPLPAASGILPATTFLVAAADDVKYDLIFGLVGWVVGLLIGVLLAYVTARIHYGREVAHLRDALRQARAHIEAKLSELHTSHEAALAAQVEESARIVEDYDRQIEDVTDALQREQEKRQEQHRKLMETAAIHKRLTGQLEEAWALAEALQARAVDSNEQHREAQARIPLERRHTIFLDGMTSSGKTTFAQHLTNPLLTTDELINQMSTAFANAYDAMPLCIARSDDGLVLHTLRFYDTVGEKPQTWTAAVLEQPLGGMGTGSAISLLIWDLSESIEVNQEYLSSWRIKATYGLPPARAVIGHVVVLFNKIDHANAVGQDLQALESLIRHELFAALDDPPALTFCSASAVTGEGIWQCLGEMIHALGLAEHYGKSDRGESALLGHAVAD